MKISKNKIIVSTLALAMGAALAGSVSGTVAWYQYSTRVTTSYVGASAKCAEALEVSLTGEDDEYKSELITSEIVAAANDDKDGSALKPVTFGVAQETGSTAAAQPGNAYKHPKYQNFEYSTWGTAEADSYLQFNLYFRVLDVDGANAKTYLAKKLYFEDFTLNFTPTNNTGSATAFKDALRVQFDQVSPAGGKRILLANTAHADLKLGGNLDLNNDGNPDKGQGYEWADPAPVATKYGDDTVLQDAEAPTTYKGTISNGSLVAGSKELGTTASGTYAKASALHFVVTVWLEGWEGEQIWDAKDYIGTFQLGMTFGITDVGQD